MHTCNFQTVSFTQNSPPQPCLLLSSPPACLFHFILLDFFTKYLGSTYHEHPQYAFSSSSLLPWPSQDLVSSSAPYSQKPSAYATVSVAKFHTRIKKKSSVYFNVYILDKYKRFWTEW